MTLLQYPSSVHISLTFYHASAYAQVSDDIGQDVALRGNCAFGRRFNLLSFLKEAFMPLMGKLLPANRIRPYTKCFRRHVSTRKRIQNTAPVIVERLS
jgi:hypothetical protein